MIIRDRYGCERIGARCQALAEKFDLPVFRWIGWYWMGWAKAQRLTLSEGLALMEEVFPLIVYEQLYKLFGAALAEARFDGGSMTDALALEITRSIPERARGVDYTSQKYTGSGACS